MLTLEEIRRLSGINKEAEAESDRVKKRTRAQYVERQAQQYRRDKYHSNTGKGDGVYSVRTVTYANKPKFKLRRIPTSQSRANNLKGLDIKGLSNSILQSFKLQALVPEELITHIRHAHDFQGRRFPGLNAEGNLSKLNAQGVSHVVDFIRQAADVQQRMYSSWVISVGKFLRDPQIPYRHGDVKYVNITAKFPATSYNRKRGHIGLSYYGLQQKDVSVDATFKSLSYRHTTAKYWLKDTRGQSFWRHTGALSRAYDIAAAKQLDSLRTSDFIALSSTNVSSLNSQDRYLISNEKGKQTFALTATVHFKLGIPRWKGAPYMDAIFTEPYAGFETKPSIVKLENLPDLRRSKAEWQRRIFQEEFENASYSNSTIEQISAKAKKETSRRLRIGELESGYSRVAGGIVDEPDEGSRFTLTGLARILNPEVRRPVISHASYQAGKQARELLASIQHKLQK